MSYTSSPNGLFTYTITGVSDSTELAVIQSAFNKWDSICQIDTSRWGSSYSIIVSYSIASLATGILGGASLQTYNISQGTTYGNIMPYEGTIQLNSLYTTSMLSDVRSGGKTQYYYVVLHELGHILGIGPFWSSSSPIYAPITSYTDANDSTTKYYYTGTNAFNQYKSYLYGDALELIVGLPIEDNGGSGTAEVHPEEGLENEISSDTRYINGIFHPGLNDELMTGWMEGSPTDTPISRVTLGFLADMGYIVDYNDAESFSIIYTSMSFSNNPELFHQQDFGYFNNANKFKESYMKTLLDVSGDIRLDSNYTAIFNALTNNASPNMIKNELKTNNLNNLSDLSINKRLFVQNDISLNKKMFIAGDLSVNGTLQFPDNSLSESDFTDSFGGSAGTNQFNNNNSQIKGALDISGLEFYVAGDVTVVNKDFQVEGNTYANNFINDDLDNLIMEDDSLINRLDLNNNAFSISKIYYDTSYSNIASDFSYNAVPFISDNGKNICYPTYDIDGTTNYYNTLYSNNHGTSFIDMATRLEGTAGSTNTKGLLNFYATENQKYIYGYHHSEGIKRSDNYGYTFTDISMVNVPNSDLSYYVAYPSRNSAFDTTHSNLIASSASGKHVYLGGFKCYDVNGPNITIPVPNYNWDFRVASSSSITDTIQGVTATYVGTTSTVENGLAYTGTTGHATLPTGINNGPGENSVEFYIQYASALDSWDTLFSVYTNSNCLLYLSQYGTNGNLTVINGDSGNTGDPQPQITNISTTAHLNKWLHIIATYEHTSGDTTCTGRFYVNGSLVSTHTGLRKVNDTSTSASTSTGYIGSPVSDSQYNNTGYIRYFRLYNKMLSDTEVTALYTNRDETSYKAIDYGHFLIKSSDFGQTMNFDLSASAINMVTHQNSDLSFNSMIGSRHVSCSADGKYVICSVHGFTPEDDLNIVSATDSSANWYPVLSRDYGTNWDLLDSKIFKDYHLLENTDASFNTSKSLNNCVGTAVSKTGKYVACAFNSTTSIPKPIMFYLSSDYGKTFDLKANLEVDDATYISNGLQISLSSNAETISLVSTKSASKVYSSSDYGTTWNTKSIVLSNDQKEHYSQISSNSQFLIRNITTKTISNSVTANSTITFDSSLSAIAMQTTAYTGTTNTPFWYPQSNANVISNDDGDIILLGAPKSTNNHSSYKGTGTASVFKYQTVTETEYNNAVKDLVRKYDGTDDSRSNNRVLFTSGNSWSADQKFWYQQGAPIIGNTYFYRSFLGQGSMGMSSDGLTIGIGHIPWWSGEAPFHTGVVRCWEYRTVTEDEWNNGFPIQWTSIAAVWQYENGREVTTLGYGRQGAYNVTAYPTIITDEAGAVSPTVLGGASNITEQHDPNKKYWVQKGINDVCHGRRYGDVMGSAVSLSSDGNTIACGAPDNVNGHTNKTGYNTTNALSSQFNNNNNYKGSISVFHYNSTSTRWEQMGSDFIGTNDGDHIGDIDTMKLSKDGSVLIYLEKDGTNGKGIIKAWKWSNPGSSSGSWSQMGNDIIVGDNQYDFYGGLPNAFNANLSNLTGITSAAGSTYWYGMGIHSNLEQHYVTTGGNERGLNVNLAGVDINDDGSVVAIGSFFVNDHKGAVKVYEYSAPGATGGSWSQKGSTVTGRGDSEEMFSKPSLNGDGTVLLVGAHFRTASYARIHKFTNNDWVQIGNDIQGVTNTDTTLNSWGYDVAHFGGYVRLNKDGTKAFISDTKSNNDAENVTGLTQVYNLSSEIQISYYNSKLCKQITPYVKTYYTHMVKDFSNISNGNSSADSSITYSGGILTASDYRLKSNVQPLQNETVDNLQPVKFTFKNSQHETFGLIAHELQENYPFLVDGEKDGTHYQTVNYNGLLGVLVHELQLIRKGLEEYE